MSHPISGYWGVFSLQELVEEVCRSLAPHIQAQSIQTVIDVSANHTLAGYRELLVRAVRNLALNAIDAMPQGGTLTATSAVGLNWVELEIADTGPALTEEQRQQAFELHPTAQRMGTEWGLAVVHRIAELHGGRVTTANCPEGGAAFTLQIPRTVALEAAA